MMEYTDLSRRLEKHHEKEKERLIVIVGLDPLDSCTRQREIGELFEGSDM